MAIPNLYQTNDIVEMRAKGTYFGEPFEIIQHFRQQDAPYNSRQWADVMRQYFLNELNSVQVIAARWISVSTRRISPLPVTPEETQVIVAAPGGWSGEGMPHQLAVLVKKRTALDAPAGRGRLYVPGVPVQWYVNGSWNNSAVATMNSLVSRLMQWGQGGGYSFAKWGVASRQTHPVSFNVINSLGYSGQPATMRSRRPNVY